MRFIEQIIDQSVYLFVSIVNGVQSVIRVNRRVTVRKFADEIETSVELCHAILSERLDMHPFAARYCTTNAPRQIVNRLVIRKECAMSSSRR